jgi:hypothetical protein
MLTGEKAVVVFAQLKFDQADGTETPKDLFQVDRLGNISLTTKGKDLVGEGNYEIFPYTLNEKGAFGGRGFISDYFYPTEGDLWIQGITSSMDATEECDVMVCLFRFDSRAFDPETKTVDVGPDIHAWSAVRLATIMFGPMAPGVTERIFDFDLPGAICLENVQPKDNEILALASLEVNGEIKTGDDLVAHLTPKMVNVTQIADGLSLTGNSPDVITYTLQTKTSLDEEWVDFDTVAEQILADVNEKLSQNEQKTLAENFQKCYTCLRVKDSTQIKIPRSPKETQRFYRLKAE